MDYGKWGSRFGGWDGVVEKKREDGGREGVMEIAREMMEMVRMRIVEMAC